MMNKYQLLEKAIRIASNAHFGQTDKAGMPYIFHPLRVMEQCISVEEKIVAILHDTIEDTEITANCLFNDGFPAYIVEAVQSLTRLENESYEGFIQRVSQNLLATKIKIADLQDNLNLSRLDRITEKDFARIERYIKSLAYLKSKGGI